MTLVGRAVRLVQQLTPTPIASAEILSAGRMTLKAKVILADQRELLVRFYPPGREAIAEFEPALLARLRDAGASVPAPLASSAQTGEAFLIYEMLPGWSLDYLIARLSSSQLETVANAVYQQLSILASLDVSGWGDMDSAACATFESWHAFVFSTTDGQGFSNLPGWLVDATETLRFIAGTRMAPPRSTLVWTDISPENIIVDGKGHFVGLIDFESVMALEPGATLGYLDARYRSTRFHRIFESSFPVDQATPHARSIYALIRALRILPHRWKPLLNGGVRDPLHIVLPGLEEACKDLLNWGKIAC